MSVLNYIHTVINVFLIPQIYGYWDLANLLVRAASVSVQTLQCHYSAGTDVGRGALKQPAIECLTLCLTSGINVDTLS